MTRLQEGMEQVEPPQENYAVYGSGNAWSKEQTETLLTMYEQNAAFRDISLRIGKNINAISNKVFALGMRRKTKSMWKESEYAVLIRMKGEGKSRKEIGKVLGRSERAVKDKIHSLGLASR